MKRKRFTEDQIIRVLKQAEAGAKTADLYRQVGITPQTFYRWKAKYAGRRVFDAKRLGGVEAENRKVKQLLGKAQLDKAALKELLAKTGKARAAGPDGPLLGGAGSAERASGL